jgi:hypothetical protein
MNRGRKLTHWTTIQAPLLVNCTSDGTVVSGQWPMRLWVPGVRLSWVMTSSRKIPPTCLSGWLGIPCVMSPYPVISVCKNAAGGCCRISTKITASSFSSKAPQCQISWDFTLRFLCCYMHVDRGSQSGTLEHHGALLISDSALWDINKLWRF